jgi:hypothetical protein
VGEGPDDLALECEHVVAHELSGSRPVAREQRPERVALIVHGASTLLAESLD